MREKMSLSFLFRCLVAAVLLSVVAGTGGQEARAQTGSFPTFNSPTPIDHTVTLENIADGLPLPQAVGGTGRLTYGIDPELPHGLSLDAGNLRIEKSSGVAFPATIERTAYTLTATDENGDQTGWDFHITVENRTPDFGTPTAIDKILFLGDAFGFSDRIELFEATDGNGAINYTISPLPNNLLFRDPRPYHSPYLYAFSYQPLDTLQPRTAYTLTATDADGDTDTYTFHLTIEEDIDPDFDSASEVDLKFTVGGEIPHTQLPAANNGNGTLEYATTALPGGLRFNARTRRISGIPTTVQPRTQYSLTAKDYNGDTATFNYYITVESVPFGSPPTFGSPPEIDVTYTVGSEIVPPLQLPSASVSAGTLTYSTTALPVGLTFDPDTRTVSGTPVAVQAKTRYTLTAVDGNSNSGTYDFYITVEGVTFGSLPEIDVTYTVGSEIIPPLQLPSAIVGAGTLTYTTTALPIGLTFDPDTRRISGTPNTPQERTVYTLTATDSVNSATFDFHITVEGIVFARSPVIDRTFIVGTEITSFQLPEATGGGVLTYSTTALPVGLTFDSTTRRISGTPTTRQTRTRYILTATDGVNSATFDFYIAVENLTFAWPVIDKLFVVGAGVTAFQLPEATGGVGSVTYTTTALPTGLAFEPSTRRISGTLSVTQARTGYTLTAVDGDGNRATYDFYITVVNESARPTFGSTAPIDWTFTPENISGGLFLPQAVGGTGRLTYAVNPALPVGLNFNAQNPSLGLSDNRYARTTVNFPAALPRTRYTLTATDENGDQATWAFHITVTDIEPDFGTPPPIDSVFISGLRPRQYGEEDIIFLPRALGNGAITYEVSSTSLPDLRSGPFPFHPFPHHLHDGLFFEAHDLLLGIDSPAMLTRTQYTLTATDADGDTATWTFHLTVEENTAPDFSAVSEIDMTFSPGAEISPIQLPEATGGNRPLIGYTITSGTLPPGLVFNTLSRTISGTPVSGQEKTRLVMTATDRNGDTAEFTFHITIDGIAFAYSPLIDRTFVAGTEITAFQLPEATSDGVLTYSTNTLPTGLAFDPATRAVSGTPTATQARTLYTLTAVDGDGNSGTYYFYITVVNPSTQPTFGSTAAIDRTFTLGNIADGLPLPEATGGTGRLIYSLSPSLPSGLVFEAERRAVVQCPNCGGDFPVVQSRTQYTLRAEDENGQAAEFSFHIAVADTQPDFGSQTADMEFVRDGFGRASLPLADDGNGAVTYTITPSLPAGLRFVTSLHSISGTPTATQARTSYTLTATDEDGDTDTMVFSLTVLDSPPHDADATPDFGSPTPIDKVFIVGAEITAFQLPEATGGDGALTYAATLPAGLSFDPDTRTVSGSPTTAQERTGHTLTVQDSDGDTEVFSFYITVEEDTQPAFDAPSAINFEFNVGEYDFVILPEAIGGNGKLTYEVTPSLPDGLRYYAPDRILGAPTVASASAEYTVTATDADGDTDTMNFTLAVFGATTVTETVTEANEETLPRVARAIASDVTGALQDSIRGAFSGGVRNAFSVKGGDWRQFLAAEVSRENERGEMPEINLADFAFSVASSDWDDPYYETGGLSVGFRTWGRGYQRNLNTSSGEADIDGSVTGGIVGVDTLITPGLLLGVSANLFSSKIDFHKPGDPVLPHRTEAWSLHPYLGWQPSSRVVLWVTAGYGLGDVEVAKEGGGCGPLGNECLKSDINLITGGGGGSVLLGNIKVGDGQISIDMAGDVALVRMLESDSVGGFETDGGTARWGLDFSYGRQVGLSGSFSGDISLAYRYDFGDSGSGDGLESGVGINFNIPGSGLRINANGRALVSGTDSVDEYGFSGHIAWSYDSGGTGPYVNFSPQWGATNDKRDELWEQGIAEIDSAESDRRRYDIEAGYGVPLVDGSIMTVFARSEMEGGTATSKSGGVDVKTAGGFTAGYEAVSRLTSQSEHRGYLRFSREF